MKKSQNIVNNSISSYILSESFKVADLHCLFIVTIVNDFIELSHLYIQNVIPVDFVI